MRVMVGLLILLGAVVGLRALLPDTEPAPPEQLGAAERTPRYYLKQASWVQLGPAGQVEYQVQASAARYYDDESAQLEELVINGLAGTDNWSLRAPEGYAPPHERRMLLEGPVRGNGQWTDGERFALQTEHLWLDTLRREIYTEAPVELVSKHRNLNATGMRADWAGSELQLQSRVRVRYEQLD